MHQNFKFLETSKLAERYHKILVIFYSSGKRLKRVAENTNGKLMTIQYKQQYYINGLDRPKFPDYFPFL